MHAARQHLLPLAPVQGAPWRTRQRAGNPGHAFRPCYKKMACVGKGEIGEERWLTCVHQRRKRERRRERGVWARALGTNVGVLGGARDTYKKIM